MARSLRPHIDSLDGVLTGRISLSEYEARVIKQYCYVDAGVFWSREWDIGVAEALEQLHGDSEVFIPDSPADSYMTLEAFLGSARRILGVPSQAERGASGTP